MLVVCTMASLENDGQTEEFGMSDNSEIISKVSMHSPSQE